jgi:hypothetical protein
MSKRDFELILWSHLYFEMHQVPDDLRSQNHTAFLREIEFRIAELESEK